MSMTTSLASRGHYRSASTAWSALAALASGLVFVVLAVVNSRGQAAALVVAGVMFLLTWRAWTAGIHIEEDGVRIVGVFVSRRVGWDDIDHFAVLPLSRYPYSAHVVLRNEHKLGTLGLATSPDPSEMSRLRIQQAVDELNRILSERQQRTS
ncbi:MAG: hypothetical protein QOF83_379 [Solirubrobacteraceae bacterium]|jgi:glucose dehydrogenase|nr:hypothetical protein [Solirubrobacteraceae bacterium]